MTDKRYINAQTLHELSIDLCKLIIQNQFYPDLIVGIWRGGAPIAITIHEFLDFCEIPSDHIAVRARSYDAMRQTKNMCLDGLEYVVKNSHKDTKLLIVDDVFDTGLTIAAIINTLQAQCGQHYPKHIKIATPFYKPTSNQTQLKPDYYIHSTKQWLVFPHELKGLNNEELKQHKQYEYEAISSLKLPKSIGI